MRRALVGSIAVHAVFGALLVSIALGRGNRRGMGREPIVIEVVEVAPPAPPPPKTAPIGGSLGAAGSRSAPLHAIQRAAARTTRSPSTATRLSELSIHEDGDPRGELAGAGEGAGLGGGRGAGIGFGDGGQIAPPPPPPPPPPPAAGEPPRSKARPARLIYPTRQREVDDAQLFVIRVLVDDDGYVAGAKLVRGFGGRRDDQASELIWRFRYAPALDDDGKPIRSTVEQRFLVQ